MEHLTPIELLVYRYSTSFIITFPFLVRIIRTNAPSGILIYWRIGALISIHIGLQAYCLTLIPAGWYAVIFAFAPFLTLVIFKSTFTPRSIALYAGMLVGAVLFVDMRTMSLEEVGYLGVAAGVGTTVAWVFYTKAVAQLSGMSNWDIAAVNNTVLAICTWFVAALAPDTIRIAVLDISSYLPAIALAVSVPIGYALFSFALRHTPIFTISAQNIELGITVFAAAVVLGERIAVQQVIGAAIVMAGLWGIAKSEKASETFG